MWQCVHRMLTAGIVTSSQRLSPHPLTSSRHCRCTHVLRSRLLLPQMLDENHHLIQCILDHQSKGKTAECAQ